jgi:hypothetical protein
MLLGFARDFLSWHLIEKAGKLASRENFSLGPGWVDRLVLRRLTATNAGASQKENSGAAGG